MAPLEFSVFQGEVGVGAAGPRGPRGFPGPRVGPSINIPSLDSLDSSLLEADLSITSLPTRARNSLKGFQAAKFPFPPISLRSFGFLLARVGLEFEAAFKFAAPTNKS